MKVEVAKRIWESEYKPSIQLLVDNGDTSYRPAMILIFCAIEHAYRAIKRIPEKNTCIQEAIQWVFPFYSPKELKGESNSFQDFQGEKLESIDLLREQLFNALKHVGREQKGIEIGSGKFAFYTTSIVSDIDTGKVTSRTDTFHVHGLWGMTVKRLDEQYSSAINNFNLAN